MLDACTHTHAEARWACASHRRRALVEAVGWGNGTSLHRRCRGAWGSFQAHFHCITRSEAGSLFADGHGLELYIWLHHYATAKTSFLKSSATNGRYALSTLCPLDILQRRLRTGYAFARLCVVSAHEAACLGFVAWFSVRIGHLFAVAFAEWYMPELYLWVYAPIRHSQDVVSEKCRSQQHCGLPTLFLLRYPTSTSAHRFSILRGFFVLYWLTRLLAWFSWRGGR